MPINHRILDGDVESERLCALPRVEIKASHSAAQFQRLLGHSS